MGDGGRIVSLSGMDTHATSRDTASSRRQGGARGAHALPRGRAGPRGSP
jgi:hypothetical protein